eukprot:5475739-Pyramimonas_sp.AAC.1
MGEAYLGILQIPIGILSEPRRGDQLVSFLWRGAEDIVPRTQPPRIIYCGAVLTITPRGGLNGLPRLAVAAFA